MDPRERWQALQAHLTTARASIERGDRDAALTAVEAALALDPDFLAAHALRDRLQAPPAIEFLPELPLAIPAASMAAADVSFAESAAAPAIEDLPLAPVVEAPLAPVVIPTEPPPPLVSAERYASFEQRAKRRRVDRRLDAARDAIVRGRVKEAEAALEEVVELDPNSPDLSELTAQLDALRRRHTTPHVGRWVAAAAAFGGIVLGATLLQEAGALRTRASVAVSPSTAAPPASVVASASTAIASPESTAAPAAANDVTSAPPSAIDAAATATTGNSTAQPVDPRESSTGTAVVEASRTAEARDAREPMARPAVDTRPADARLADVVVPAALPAAPPPIHGVIEPIAPTVAPPTAPPVQLAKLAPEPVLPPPPIARPIVPAAAPSPSAIAAPTEEALVRQTLQRYRSAYDELDAHSARAVWPAVNESALARAFDSLQSQALTFENCNVQLQGEAAAATCRGSARYVPKIGSHEPRVEPRTWSFTLRKNGPDWQIESARAGR